jgi:preprotein translocase subunit SecG
MYYVALIIHVLVCLFLVIVVLLQSGKAADLAGAFGGMGSQTAFGPRGSATLLSKATTVSFIVFIITSMTLSILATRQAGLGTSVLEEQQSKPAPARPAPVQPAPTQGVPTMNGKPIELPKAPGPAPAQGAPAQAPAHAPVKK